MSAGKNRKLMQLYQSWKVKLSPPVLASFWFTVCSFLQKGIQMITAPIFTRLLSTEQYGQFSLYSTWMNLISVFATLNLSAGVYNNGMIRYQDDRDAYTSSMQGLSTVSVLIFFGIYLATSNWWNDLIDLPGFIIVIMFIEVLLTPALQFWTSRQRFEFRYKALVTLTLTIAILNPLLGIAAVYLTEERGIARILTICAINIIIGGAFYIRNLYVGKRFFVKEYWRYALMFNLPLIPHYLSQMILSQADRIMIERSFGKAPIAIYSIANNVGMIMTIIINSINASFIPWTYQKCKESQYQQIGSAANKLLILTAGISLIPIMMAPEVITLLAPPEYAEAIWMIPPLAISGYFMLAYSLFANIEFYCADNFPVMIASSIAAIVNIVLNYFCLRKFSYIAASYTTLICYVLLTIAHYCFMRRSIKKHRIESKIYSLRVMIAVSAAVCAAAAGCMALYKLPAIRYGILVAGVIGTVIFRKTIIGVIKSFMKGNRQEKH